MKILVIQTPHYDFCAATIIEGLRELKKSGRDIELVCSETSNYGGEYVSLFDKETVSFGKDADLIIVTSNGGVKEHLLIEINKWDNTVYIDGEDRYEYHRKPHDWKIYFKREMRKDILHPDNVYPFPFGAETRYFQEKKVSYQDKKMDVSCMFGPHDDTKLDRIWIEDTLKRLDLRKSHIGQLYGGTKIEGVIDTGDRQHDNYYKILQHSKISVDAWGAHGCNAGRFWESLANGCCLYTQPILIHMPHPFKNHFHLVEFPNSLVLEKSIMNPDPQNLGDGDVHEQIANAGYEHLLKYHTTVARAKYLIETFESQK